MRFTSFNVIPAMLLAAGFLASSAQAGVIDCGDSYRKASLGAADSCYSQTIGSTVKAWDLASITGNSWTQVGELGAAGSDGWFSVSGWGSNAASGSWAISSAFWKTYGSALITMHVGGGQKDAVDNFEWVVTPEETSGNWLYSKLLGKGGGLSNIKLWGTGTPQVEVPESGSWLMLLIGLFSIAVLRRKV